MRIPGFRHKWVNAITVTERNGKYFSANGDHVRLVAIQRAKRVLRPKKTVYIYVVGTKVFYADDPFLDKLVPLVPDSLQAVKYQVFTNPTTDQKYWLANYNYVLVSDQINV